MNGTGTPERPARVLVIDDEEQIRRALRSVLKARHWTVDLAENGEAGIEAAATHPPDVIVLDLTLPGMSGFDVCKELREWYVGPILVLSVRGGEEDKIRALELGADDYLTKPFSTGELIARMRALMRRSASGDASLSEVCTGDLLVDFARRRVVVRGEEVRLTKTEFDILAVLARNLDRVVTSRMLFDEVWEPDYLGEDQTLRTHVSNLRKKIERPGDVPRLLLTEPGVGFRLVSRDSG